MLTYNHLGNPTTHSPIISSCYVKPVGINNLAQRTPSNMLFTPSFVLPGTHGPVSAFYRPIVKHLCTNIQHCQKLEQNFYLVLLALKYLLC